jgi:hypothetical protein
MCRNFSPECTAVGLGRLDRTTGRGGGRLCVRGSIGVRRYINFTGSQHSLQPIEEASLCRQLCRTPVEQLGPVGADLGWKSVDPALNTFSLAANLPNETRKLRSPGPGVSLWTSGDFSTTNSSWRFDTSVDTSASAVTNHHRLVSSA